MFIQTVMPQDIVELCLATYVVSKAYNITSHSLCQMPLRAACINFLEYKKIKTHTGFYNSMVAAVGFEPTTLRV